MQWLHLAAQPLLLSSFSRSRIHAADVLTIATRPRATPIMKLSPILFAATVLIAPVFAKEHGNTRGDQRAKSNKGANKGGDDDDGMGRKNLTLTIINESYDQPFSPFFVMAHNSNADRLYVREQPSSEPLALLTENGVPAHLVDFYTENDNGVFSAKAFNEGAPYFGGETFQVQAEVSGDYSLVIIATMATNNNDCFTALNGVRLYPDMVLDLPGLDAGSEENDEECNSIPGPGCASIIGDNVISRNDEGFVRVHR